MSGAWNAAAAVAAILVLAVAAGCGGDDADSGSAASTPSPAPTSTPTATSAPTTSATPEAPLDQALWPPADDATADPLHAARAFVTEYIGLARPLLGGFEETEPGAGEVQVHRTGEGGGRLEAVVATLTLRRLDGRRWFVTSAASPEVIVTRPEPLSRVGSPLVVTGRGRGFEGNVVLQVRAAGSAEPLAERPVVAGSMGELEPFEVTLRFEAPADEAGAVVALTGSGVAAADGFAAFPVRFGG